MLTIWIIHRDANRRAALARIAGAGDNTLIGHPSDDIFASAAPADAVVLAPSGDFELELQFAHRMAPRRSDSRWIILAEPADLAEARRLFDTLRAEFLPFPQPRSRCASACSERCDTARPSRCRPAAGVSD